MNRCCNFLLRDSQISVETQKWDCEEMNIQTVMINLLMVLLFWNHTQMWICHKHTDRKWRTAWRWLPAHRQRPVDAGHLRLQPEQVHEEEDEEGDEEPQRHHLKVLESRPAGPTASTVDAQEGDEQRELGGNNATFLLSSSKLMCRLQTNNVSVRQYVPPSLLFKNKFS